MLLKKYPITLAVAAIVACVLGIGLTGCFSIPSGDGTGEAPRVVFTPQDADLAGRAVAYVFIKRSSEAKRPARAEQLERIATDIERALTDRSELTQELLRAWTARLVEEGQLEADDAAFLVPIVERVWAKFRPDLAPLPTLDPAVKDNVLAFTAGIRAHLELINNLSAGT
jgi:hypothetical protein